MSASCRCSRETRPPVRNWIEHNLRLVAHIIKKYYADQNDQDDLISIGTIGLIKAIDGFDARKGDPAFQLCGQMMWKNEILMFFRSKRKMRRISPLMSQLTRIRTATP